MRRHLFAVLVLLAAAAVPAAPAAAQDRSSPNMFLVDNVPYPQQYEEEPANYGTDIEFMSRKGRRYALAGSYYNGLQIFDLSRPGEPRRTAIYDCGILQGDVQVFRAADRSGRMLATYTSDSSSAMTESRCFRDAERLGFEPTTEEGDAKQGTFIVDVTNPSSPKTVSFIEVPQGSHNMTVHPSGGYLYNSNSDLITSLEPAIEVIDIRRPNAPRKVGELALEARPGLGTESHDITFNEAGTRAYSSALSHGVVIDTSKPATPKIITTFDDEAINVWHQSDPFTLETPEGTKEFLIAEDEFAGAAGGPVCPSGGVHVYDITGEKENAPEKVGYWNIDDFGPTHDPQGTCTAHVFDIHEREQLMTMAFYNGGVRVIDLKGLATGEGLKAVASYQAEDADSWSFKAPTVTRTGVFYAYGNDIARGLDVYKVDMRRPPATNVGTWIPAPALLGTSSNQSAPEQQDGGAGAMLPVAVRPAADAKTVVDTTVRQASSVATGAAATSLANYRMFCLLASSGSRR